MKLMRFVEEMASGAERTQLDSLVLNGDILEEGFDVKRFNALIRRISQHIDTYFVVGNHDVQMEKRHVREAWGDRVKFMGDDFSMHGICFTHGHLQDIASHASPESGLGALAYYVSRATTTPKEHNSCDT